MGLGRDQTRDPWICSQTRICCQTLYRLRYTAHSSQSTRPVRRVLWEELLEEVILHITPLSSYVLYCI